MNLIKDVMCYMLCDTCYVYNFMCCVQYDKFDDACYSHGMTFLIQIWKALTFLIQIWNINFPNPNFASALI